MKYKIPVNLKLQRLNDYIWLSIKGKKELDLFYKYLKNNNIDKYLKRIIMNLISNNKAYIIFDLTNFKKGVIM